jgi:spore germination protein GerM
MKLEFRGKYKTIFPIKKYFTNYFQKKNQCSSKTLASIKRITLTQKSVANIKQFFQ